MFDVWFMMLDVWCMIAFWIVHHKSDIINQTSSKNHNAKIIPPERRMSLDVRQCPRMSLNVLIKVKKDRNDLVEWWIFRIFVTIVPTGIIHQTSSIIHQKSCFNPVPTARPNWLCFTIRWVPPRPPWRPFTAGWKAVRCSWQNSKPCTTIRSVAPSSSPKWKRLWGIWGSRKAPSDGESHVSRQASNRFVPNVEVLPDTPQNRELRKLQSCGLQSCKLRFLGVWVVSRKRNPQPATFFDSPLACVCVYAYLIYIK